MKKLIGIFLILIVSIGARAAVTEKQVEQLLLGFHSISWQKIIESPTDNIEIRNILHRWASGEKPNLNLSTKEFELFRQRALKEYGKFAVDENGTLSEQAKILFQQLQNEPSLKLSLMTSLRNANSVEAANLLLAFIDPHQKSSDKTYAIGLIGQMLNNESLQYSNKMDGSKGYHPNLGKALAERNNPQAWRQFISKLTERLIPILRDSKTSAALVATIHKTQKTYIKLISAKTPAAEKLTASINNMAQKTTT